MESYKAVAKYVFSKKTNTGVMVNEDKAKFDMQWQKDKVIEDKMKLAEARRGVRGGARRGRVAGQPR